MYEQGGVKNRYDVKRRRFMATTRAGKIFKGCAIGWERARHGKISHGDKSFSNVCAFARFS